MPKIFPGIAEQNWAVILLLFYTSCCKLLFLAFSHLWLLSVSLLQQGGMCHNANLVCWGTPPVYLLWYDHVIVLFIPHSEILNYLGFNIKEAHLKEKDNLCPVEGLQIIKQNKVILYFVTLPWNCIIFSGTWVFEPWDHSLMPDLARNRVFKFKFHL